MAKSLRSKRRRKIRAEKRIVNAKKELVKLKEVAAKLHGAELTRDPKSIESTIPGVQVTTAPTRMDIEQEESTGGTSVKHSSMKINTKWMNQRKIKAIKGKIKRHNKAKARRRPSASVSSRKSKRSSKK